MIQKLVYTVVHVIFWVVYLMLSWSNINQFEDSRIFFGLHPEAHVLMLFWAMCSFYSFYFYVHPKFFDRGRYVSYFLISLLVATLLTLFAVSSLIILYDGTFMMFWPRAAGGILGSFIIAQCGSLLKGFVNWNENIQKAAELENRSLRNELSTLKAQLSPHFLFNTLNNIDTLIHKSQDEASATLIKLSDLLRYMLYDSETKAVSIGKEIDYMKQLIDLQRLRFQDQSFVKLEVNCLNTELKIAPLLFLPFIENAFKFVTTGKNRPAISIKLDVNENQVKFFCMNYFDATQLPTNEGGIGLANTRRRLELLYKDNYDLTIDSSQSTYQVSLNLTIDEDH